MMIILHIIYLIVILEELVITNKSNGIAINTRRWS